jgi:hypothetical protein
LRYLVHLVFVTFWVEAEDDTLQARKILQTVKDAPEAWMKTRIVFCVVMFEILVFNILLV